MMYQPQQMGVITEMARAMEDRQITALETQRIMDATLAFGISAIFAAMMGVLVRDFLKEALEPEQKKAIRPVIDVMLPATAGTAGEIFARAKQYFGTTTDPGEAGYILPDGAMLDFSGKGFNGGCGKRLLDHRDIAFAWPEDDSPGGFEAMKQVMNWGAVRFSIYRETIVVDLVKPLTEAQKKAIDRALWHNPDAVLVVEVDNPELQQVDYREFTYPFTSWKAFIERSVAVGTPAKPAHTSPVPQARRKDIDTLDRLIMEKHQDVNWEKWPHGTISDARKAVYKDVLEGFDTLQEAKEYIENMPEDSVIFTARGDEITFSLIKIVIADIERNPWLSPFTPERQSEITRQLPLMPVTSIARDDLKRIADKYGWWAAKLAEAVCPHNDVACVEREARRLAEARRARLG